jgi:hypothetical protein
MLKNIDSSGVVSPQLDLRIRCPGCLHLVSLLAPADDDIRLSQDDEAVGFAGMRLCPNRSCRQLLFVIYDAGEIIASYPPERVDFDATNIPTPILEAFEEAISCHSIKCYTAAGIMIRKTLELLCDNQQTTGNNLKSRISSLSSKVVLPKELLDGMDDLRLLGNDAAHVSATTYQQVGQSEIKISLEFTKEILKAVYQYSDLLNRLRSLKKP